MKSKFTKLVGGVFLSLFMVPSTALADAVPTTLASWTFDTGYDVASNVYTPNTNDWAQVGWNGFGTLPQIRPNSCLGTVTDYYVSAKGTRFWGIIDNNGDKIFSLYQDQDPNDIADYTNPDEHNQYIEFNFPTSNYKNVQFNFSFTCGSNTVRNFVLVYSTDGGTTWTNGGSYEGTNAWYIYKTSTVNLLASNKESVKVRLIAENGATDQWRLNEASVTGEYATEFTPEYTLATSVSPASAGTITRSINAASYEENTVVSLTAIPNLGFAFVEWQDGLGNQLSTTNPYDVTMTENKTVVAVFAVAPILAGTEITAASWTFDTGYDVSGLEYTPNDAEWEGIAQVQSKNGNVPLIHANAGYGKITQYTASVSNDNTGNTYYSVKDNNGDKIFSLYPTSTSNTITDAADYLDASKHTVYYQFSFPTKGLNNIKASVSFTYGSNAVKNLEMVYSIDGGLTWADGGSCEGSSGWWTYNETEKSLTAENADEVIVRLLPANGETGDYRMNSFTVKGKIATAPVTVSAVKYATYYNTVPVMLPEGLQAATVDGETSGKLTLNYRYAAGNVIPAETPVLLKAEAGKDYDLTYVANDETAAPTGNLLRGTAVAKTTDGGAAGDRYYALQNGDNGVGFYWAAENGAAFTIGANKAWLVLTPSSARFFSLEDDATGIDSVTRETLTNSKVYNLQGQEVKNAQKGIFIVNGKKVIMK